MRTPRILTLSALALALSMRMSAAMSMSQTVGVPGFRIFIPNWMNAAMMTRCLASPTVFPATVKPGSPTSSGNGRQTAMPADRS